MKTSKFAVKGILAVIVFALIATLLLFSLEFGGNAHADDDGNAFVGQDPQKSLEVKSNELKYTDTAGTKAVLTVLLPDLNEDGSAWSRSLIKEFSYDENSLPERLKNNSGGKLYSAMYINAVLHITELPDTNYVYSLLFLQFCCRA